MLRFQSLQTRITALSTALFGIALLLVALSMQWAISVRAEDKVREELASSAKVINRIWSMRSQELEGVARPLALDFGFRGAVATDDDETIRSALQNIASRIDLPNAFIVKYDGRVVGMEPSQDRSYDAELWSDLDSGWHSGALRIGNSTYQAVAAEIKAPALIGWLVIGRKLDAAETRELSALSAVPVRASIVRRAENGGWVHDDSGKPVEERGTQALLSRMSSAPGGAEGTMSDRLDGKMVLVRPLGSTNGEATTALMLDFSIADALAEYQSLRLAVYAAGLFGLLLVAIASRRLARHIVRPIAALEQAARKLEKGERTSVPVVSQDEIGNLTASFNAMSSEIVSRENRIRHMAFHDALTDLPNRVQLGDRLDGMLAEMTRAGGELAVLCLDLDNFKIVNDTLGHHLGDQMLKAIALRISDAAGDHFVAHSGGDEFWVLVDGENADATAVDLAQVLLEGLRDPLTIDGHLIRPGASIGLSFAPRDSMRASDLIKHADLALHKAKEAGRGKVVHFTADLDEQAQARRALETDLHAALANGEFELYFQPLFDLATNSFCAFEALIRWNHPTRGQI
ncbi:MAG: diguanylate cyclase domain protein, partial [Proteobacteria bacterium]|nr:diguanylate cyclase domain protein [Pseudomonadota bacterium]